MKLAPTTPIRLAEPELAGRTTLAEARGRTGFPIRVPTYAEGLGEPDEVYLQELFARARPGIVAPGPGNLLFRLYEARTTGLFSKGPLGGGRLSGKWPPTATGVAGLKA